ncbi:MAG: hypothetical protein K2F83_05955 [Oscillospiraceae bacterium]|nr:hypothetical protein [Oscillospiraceae bacterium]
MKRRKLLALTLAAAICLSALPVGAFAAEESRHTDFFTQREHTELAYDELEYVRPDEEAILAKMEAIRALLEDEANMEQVSELFDALGEDFIMVQTMYSLCNIQAYQDVTDEEAWDELEVLGELSSNLSDQLSILLKEILTSPCAAFLEEQLDEESIEYYKDYEPMTEEQLAFAAKEAALESEYQSAAYDLPTVEVDGVEYDADSIYDAAVSGEVDIDTYNAVATQLAKEKNALLGEIYIRMVELRQAEASSYGYDNYMEYAYENIYTRDYTPEEIRPFHEAVKAYIVPLYAAVGNLYNESIDTLIELSGVDYTGAAALDIIEPYLAQMSDELVEAFTFMREGGYYDSDFSETKASAGFTTTLPAYGAPFFFNAPGGSIFDLTTAIHEFGHYNEGYWGSHDFIDYSKNIDLAEVHSQGLELMFSHWYADLFGEEDAGAVEVFLMYNLLGSIVEGSLHDELQQYVYYTPDVTLEQINQEYRRLCGQYGFCEPDDERTEMYSWVDIHHTFTQPCYYISYAVSAAGGFAFWLAAQEGDYYEALDTYLTFTALPGIYTFTESFEEVGLEAPIDPEYIRALAGDLCWEIFGQPMPGTYEVAVNVNGDYIKFPDAQPAIVNDRTMLPLRAVAEFMGARVEWSEETYQIQIILEDTVVTLSIGSPDITVEKDGETVTTTMDVAPFLDDVYERTYVPVRFVSEAFGYQVNWDDATSTVFVMADPAALLAALLEGKSFTCMEEVGKFLAKGQEGKEQGTWSTTAEGSMTLGGLIEIPLSATLLSQPDMLLFTLSDELLAFVGMEPNTWFKLDLNALTDGTAIADDETETTGDDTAELMGDAISTLGLSGLEELLYALSDEGFEVGEDDTLTTTWGMGPVYLGLEIALENEEIACVTVMVYYADEVEALLTLSVDGTGAMAGEFGMDDGEGTELELSFTGENLGEESHIGLGGATILDLSDPEVSNALMGVMPLGDAA